MTEYSKLALAVAVILLVVCTHPSADAPPSAAGNDRQISFGSAETRAAPNLQGGARRRLRLRHPFADPKTVVLKSAEAAGNAGGRRAEEHEPLPGGGEGVWPADDEAVVPPGTYSFGPIADLSWRPAPNYGRVLLYITSHFSPQHEMFLRYCWRNSLARSPLLQGADVAVHLVPNDPQDRRRAIDLLREVFAEHNLAVYVRTYEDEQLEGVKWDKKRSDLHNNIHKTKSTGAVMAMYEGVHYGYFEGYDWVIRVNPDVLVRDDSFFGQAMADPALSALIVNCNQASYKKKRHIHLHSDFFVVRPKVLLKLEFPKKMLSGSAEKSFTTSMTNTVLKRTPKSKQTNYAWIPNAHPAFRGGCRVGAGRDFFDAPVVHEHALHPDICTVPEADVPIVESIFPEWPKSWKLVQ